MSELLICPRCGAWNYFKVTSSKKRRCYWIHCSQPFNLPDKIKGLKIVAQKTGRKLALEADIKVRTFEGYSSGRFTPSKENAEKLELLFQKYFGKKSQDDFIAQE